jgi:hypothetical protein
MKAKEGKKIFHINRNQNITVEFRSISDKITFFSFFAVLDIQPRTSPFLGKYSTTELRLQPQIKITFKQKL